MLTEVKFHSLEHQSKYVTLLVLKPHALHRRVSQIMHSFSPALVSVKLRWQVSIAALRVRILPQSTQTQSYLVSEDLRLIQRSLHVLVALRPWELAALNDSFGALLALVAGQHVDRGGVGHELGLLLLGEGLLGFIRQEVDFHVLHQVVIALVLGCLVLRAIHS